MAGASMKAIKLRIKSVESTMQITKAMQLVATSKLRRAKERMENSKPYAAISMAAMQAAVRSCAGEAIPFAHQREVKNTCYVVIAGERGLAGGYNANIFKAVAADAGDIPYVVLPIGRKAIDKFQRMGVELLDTELTHVEGLSVSTCSTLAYAWVLPTFRIFTRQVSPSRAPLTNTTCPSIRATPSPEAENPATVTVKISFFFIASP